MKSEPRAGFPQGNETLISHNRRKFTIVKLIGEGGYGKVYKCVDEENREYALKAERLEQTALKVELYVLQHVKDNGCQHFCNVIDWGEYNPNFMFIVMTLLGDDLAKIRTEMPSRKFSIGTALRLAMQTANSLQELHNCKFISRDVKPGNFAHGLKECRKLIYMFDFGLARRYTDKHGIVISARTNVGWRGTMRYGSLRAHAKQDLCRKDDLESWIYMVIEFTKGVLPWRLMSDRAKVQEEKEKARNQNRTAFLAGCPPCYDHLLTIVDALEFYSIPPYEKIINILAECCQQNNVSMGSRYDWEPEGSTSISSISATTETETIVHSPRISAN